MTKRIDKSEIIYGQYCQSLCANKDIQIYDYEYVEIQTHIWRSIYNQWKDRNKFLEDMSP